MKKFWNGFIFGFVANGALAASFNLICEHYEMCRPEKEIVFLEIAFLISVFTGIVCGIANATTKTRQASN